MVNYYVVIACNDCPERIELQSDEPIDEKAEPKRYQSAGWQIDRFWVRCPNCAEKSGHKAVIMLTDNKNYHLSK